MIKYVILAIFLVMILVTVYYFYANHINNKLNRKKEQIGSFVYKNRYTKYLRTSSICTLVCFCGVLLSFNVKAEDKVSSFVSFKDNIEYDEAFQNVGKLRSESVNLKVNTNFQKVVSDSEALYLISEGYLVKYVDGNSINTEIDEAFDRGLLVYNDKVIVYSNYADYSLINIYDSENLLLVDTIKINYIILDITVNDNFLDVITYGKLNKKLSLKISNKANDYLEYFESCYLDNSNNNKLLCHSKINLKSYDVKQFGLFVSDIYYTKENDIIYFSTNANTRVTLDTSVVFSYDVREQKIINDIQIGGLTNYNPVIIGEDIYININLTENAEYLSYKLNKKLDIINCNKIDTDLITDYIYLNNSFIKFENNVITRFKYGETKDVELDINITNSHIKSLGVDDDILNVIIKHGNKEMFIMYDFKCDELTTVNSNYDELLFIDGYLLFINNGEVRNIKG